mgnify:CR=1 FL=1
MTNKWLVNDLKSEVERSMPFKVPNFKMRLGVWAERDKYRWKEDESVWSQVMGKAYEAYEVYFDGEFVCFFNVGMTMQSVVIEILQGILKLFKEKKVYLNPEMYRIAAEEERKQKEAIDKAIKEKVSKAQTPEEKVLGEVLLRVKKKRKAARAKSN